MRILRMVGSRGRYAAFVFIIIVSVAACAERPELVRVRRDAPSRVVLRNADVVDVLGGRLLPGRDVFVIGDRIARIAPTATVESVEDALVVDAKGLTVVPGYVDNHAHTGLDSAPAWKSRLPDSEANLRSWLYCGVTSLMDAAGLPGASLDLRDAVAAGEVLGPHIYAAGPVVTGVGSHPVPVLRFRLPWFLRWYMIPRYTRQVDSDADARAAANEIADLGVDVLKVIVDRIPASAPRISSVALDAAVDAAAQRGLRAVAHIGTTRDAVDAAEAGVAAWIHGVYRERLSDDAVATLAGYGIPMVPTIVVFDSYAALAAPPRVATPLERETVPADLLASFDEIPADSPMAEFFRDYLAELGTVRDAWHDNVRRLHEAGVTILAGSDNQSGVFPGPGLHRELAHLAQSGLTPLEVLRAATLYPARFLEDTRDPDFGIVAANKRADLVLVQGNPLADASALSRIEMVMLGGKVLERMPIAAE